MTQAYSDPSRASDPYALPDVEVFYTTKADAMAHNAYGCTSRYDAGWYYWFCFPGCLPDSDPIGPYTTEAEALAAAQEEASW
jgi:hypothetical protein